MAALEAMEKETMYEKHIKTFENMLADAEIYGRPRDHIDAAIARFRAAEPKGEAAEREHCTIVAGEIYQRQLRTNHAAPDVIERERAAARAESFESGRVQAEVELAIKGDAEGAEFIRRAVSAERELTEARAALRTHSENEGRLQTRIAELETRLQRANETEYDRGYAAGRASVLGRPDSDENEVRNESLAEMRERFIAEGFAAASGLRLADQAARAEAEAKLAESSEALRTMLGREDDLQEECSRIEAQRRELETKLAALRAAAERAETYLRWNGVHMDIATTLRAAIEASKK